MAKDWQDRLDDTLEKIKNDVSPAVANRLRVQINRLTEDQQKSLSEDIAIGFRFHLFGKKDDDKTQRRHKRRADKLLANLADRSLAKAFYNAAKALNMELIELDLRLHHPNAWLKMFYGNNYNLNQAYNFGIKNKWDDSCGAISGMLRGIISADPWTKQLDTNTNITARNVAGTRALNLVRNVNYPYLRMLVGCHSFIVENIGRTCRVYQAYYAEGGDRLSDSIVNNKPMKRDDFCTHLENIIRGNANADDSAAELFNGTCDATANAHRSPVSVEIEVTDRSRNLAGMTQAFRDKAGLHADAWDEVKRSATPLDNYITWD